ncbi:16S rRNA (uracil(1498)-N(3))-methyltransferase [Schaalia vaccimaxillae]|uniref:16S rRNA (uracil(1498)-N(3))-methyltransferase n=1 Tax=Schaalia vaccimaxillae TaxID=183916 RepID=UPI0003B305D9|nr:16S rRNA (uracil(1498)-N(3))-methyltransferase [Schaalia vaccimaxillae]
MTRPVFFSDDLSPSSAQVQIGDRVELGGQEGRHAATVRRIEAGESIDIVDGRGLRLRCLVEASSKQGLILTVVERMEEAGVTPRIVLVQALAKGGRDEQAVETCTELGVDEVVPWQSNRAIVRWTGPKAAKGHAKWESVVRAAAKQSRRSTVPEVHEVVDSKKLVALVQAIVNEGGAAFVCHEEATMPLTERILNHGPDHERTASCAVGNACVVVVGPEGGIDPDETAALEAAGAHLVGLGRNVLRSSTAGAVAVTLVSAAASRL